MNEEIIIDGVDVSECRLRYYPSTQCNAFKLDNSGFHQGHCKQNPNCYYKQLKRLQEENKRLQMLSCANCGEKYLSPDGAELYEKNVQLQKENEELQYSLKTQCVTCKRELENCRILFIADKYKQALEEIREIAKCRIENLVIVEMCNEVLNEYQRNRNCN